MGDRTSSKRIIRWLLSVALVVMGLSVTWAWGQVARLAEPLPAEPQAQPPVLYSAWQTAGANQTVLYRSVDEGTTWQPLSLPDRSAPVAWADDGGSGLAVALDNGALLRSQDRGDLWSMVTTGLRVSSLAYGEADELYLGTEGQGIYRLVADGDLVSLVAAGEELAGMPVRQLALVGGRLFAATPTVLFYTDNADSRSANHRPAGETWTRSQPVLEGISALAAIDRDTLFVGTETSGVFRSTDAGQTWQPASEGLGLAAGQMVHVTALRADPGEPGVIYAAVDHLLGSTQVHASAVGTFASLNAGMSWQPLAGPGWPEARQATDLVLIPGKPLYVQAVTAQGLKGYAPDVAGALAALEGDDAEVRATAAHVLGLARAKEASGALLAALDDTAPAVSLAAADALGLINDPTTASGLLVALNHPKERVRLNAARALGAMRVEAAVEPLRTMLLTGNEAEITVAADALGRIGGPTATEALLIALSDRDATPRWHAALAALEAMGEGAVVPLTGMLASSDAGARRNAAQALGWIGSPSATAALVETLEDDSSTVREQTAWALGEIGDPAARAALERLRASDASTAARLAAEDALTRIEGQPVMGPEWPATWAPALNRLQPLRWSILGLTLVGAAWLVLGQKGVMLLSVRLGEERR